MTAFNVVKFQPKPGQAEEFERIYRSLPRDFEGLRKISLMKREKGEYVAIGEWASLAMLHAARPLMKDNLDKFKHTLADYEQVDNVTKAFSAEAIFEHFGPSR